ncbi:MAG: DASH family cryptochrome [Leptolyngbya sp. SIO3F4]|nr:DASH family cryptochrome [Leptolyngbya sp. SIO3F4]
MQHPSVENALVWFRNDLRLEDNEPLVRACEAAEQVWLVYVFDPRQWRTDPFAHRKTGPFRTRFLVEAVTDLRQQLEARNASLLVRTGLPEEVLPELQESLGFEAIYASVETTFEEQAVENQVRNALPEVAFHGFHTATLFHPEDLPFETERMPDVFTAFRKKCEKYVSVREPLPVPESIPAGPLTVKEGSIPEPSSLCPESVPEEDRGVLPFRGGASAAQARLQHYFWDANLLRSYKYTRNGLLGADYSSKFSVWLANGSLSPRAIYQEVKRYEQERVKNVSTYWLVFELIWRDFFRFHAAKYGNAIFWKRGIGQEVPSLRFDPETFETWTQGRTGIPFIDANMQELHRTGFMSNRGRQNVASFLVHDLKIDWRYGASWFESQLIDYDVCSNWANWNYVAGVGTDPRSDRYFHVIRQAEKYDGKGEYAKHWLPELEALSTEEVHRPYALSAEKKAFYALPDHYRDPLYVSPRW